VVARSVFARGLRPRSLVSFGLCTVPSQRGSCLCYTSRCNPRSLVQVIGSDFVSTGLGLSKRGQRDVAVWNLLPACCFLSRCLLSKITYKAESPGLHEWAESHSPAQAGGIYIMAVLIQIFQKQFPFLRRWSRDRDGAADIEGYSFVTTGGGRGRMRTTLWGGAPPANSIQFLETASVPREKRNQTVGQGNLT
jgi:hypothetical protein